MVSIVLLELLTPLVLMRLIGLYLHSARIRADAFYSRAHRRKPVEEIWTTFEPYYRPNVWTYSQASVQHPHWRQLHNSRFLQESQILQFLQQFPDRWRCWSVSPLRKLLVFHAVPLSLIHPSACSRCILFLTQIFSASCVVLVHFH